MVGEVGTAIVAVAVVDDSPPVEFETGPEAMADGPELDGVSATVGCMPHVLQ